MRRELLVSAVKSKKLLASLPYSPSPTCTSALFPPSSSSSSSFSSTSTGAGAGGGHPQASAVRELRELRQKLLARQGDIAECLADWKKILLSLELCSNYRAQLMLLLEQYKTRHDAMMNKQVIAPPYGTASSTTTTAAATANAIASSSSSSDAVAVLGGESNSSGSNSSSSRGAHVPSEPAVGADTSLILDAATIATALQEKEVESAVSKIITMQFKLEAQLQYQSTTTGTGAMAASGATTGTQRHPSQLHFSLHSSSTSVASPDRGNGMSTPRLFSTPSNAPTTTTTAAAAGTPTTGAAAEATPSSITGTGSRSKLAALTAAHGHANTNYNNNNSTPVKEGLLNATGTNIGNSGNQVFPRAPNPLYVVMQSVFASSSSSSSSSASAPSVSSPLPQNGTQRKG
mmetsp:Transcript_6088/g.10136  ORF Transcript_6088/g.10136 Transcript_6088/m.10136 type:complete len:403 (+) Transcript_6088:493-1701(+)